MRNNDFFGSAQGTTKLFPCGEWETHITCEMQEELNDTALLVREFPVFACLRRLQYCTNGYSPEGNRCRKPKVRCDTPKYPV